MEQIVIDILESLPKGATFDCRAAWDLLSDGVRDHDPSSQRRLGRDR